MNHERSVAVFKDINVDPKGSMILLLPERYGSTINIRMNIGHFCDLAPGKHLSKRDFVGATG